MRLQLQRKHSVLHTTDEVTDKVTDKVTDEALRHSFLDLVPLLLDLHSISLCRLHLTEILLSPPTFPNGHATARRTQYSEGCFSRTVMVTSLDSSTLNSEFCWLGHNVLAAAELTADFGYRFLTVTVTVLKDISCPEGQLSLKLFSGCLVQTELAAL